MRRWIAIFGMLTLSMAFAAQGKGKGKGKPPKDTGGARSAVAVSVVFGDGDRRAIQQWARDVPPSGLPPGLAKRGQLPPGLQKQLIRNGTLPPGLEKKLSPFPPVLAGRLAPLPPDCLCDRVFLEGRALIVGRNSRLILDVFAVF